MKIQVLNYEFRKQMKAIFQKIYHVNSLYSHLSYYYLDNLEQIIAKSPKNVYIEIVMWCISTNLKKHKGQKQHHTKKNFIMITAHLDFFFIFSFFVLKKERMKTNLW